MKQVHTVLGPITPDQMGVTLPHEHLCSADWSMRMNFGPRFCDMRRVLPRAVQQVNRAKGVGVSTIVDATAVNLGRDIHLLREVSQQTGVHLIASTGFYAQDEPWLKEQDPGYLFDLLDEECKKGIYDTDAKPGIVKCAVGRQGLTPTRKKILKLSAKVALANDLPLFCHHEAATQAGPEILDLLLAEGMDPKRVVLGHAGDSQDLAYIFSLLERGCFIGDDRYGYGPLFNATPHRIQTLIALRTEGFLGQVLLSHDLSTYLGFWEPMETTLANPAIYGDADFTFLFRQVFPILEKAGFSPEELRQLTTDNPRALFS